jgi:peptidoglycan-associated lipoprotein
MKSRSLTAASVALFVIAPAALTIMGCKKQPPPEPAPTPAPVQEVAPPKPVVEPPPPPPPPPPPAPKRVTAADMNAQKVVKVIYFDLDKYDLRADARATLAQNAKWLKENPSWRIQIEGHCDERGTNDYNLALGDRRANSARDYLISAGVPASRVQTISYGEERPGTQGNNEAAWARNRRGEFVIKD